MNITYTLKSISILEVGVPVLSIVDRLWIKAEVVVLRQIPKSRIDLEVRKVLV